MTVATLNGVTVTAARVQLPAWGVWYADVECASSDALTGAATLILGDLTLVGTILSGGVVESRTRYRLAGGAGGWGQRIAAQAYLNDLGVKKSKVLADAAAACGETLGTLPSGTVGPSFVRAEGPASAVLTELFPAGWYVDDAGVTQIGARTASTYKGGATRTINDAKRGLVELAPESLASLLPGVTVDGVTAVDVEHVLEAGKLRTTIWGEQSGRDGDPVASRLGQFVDLRTAAYRYFAPYEYRVVLRHTERYDLQCVRRSTGMPDLLSVRIAPGVSGLRARPKLGSMVLVSFVNGDRARPVITSFDDYDSGGFIPDEIYVQAGTTGSNTGVTEHATSAEALVVAVQTTLAAVGAALTTAGEPGGAAITALVVDATFATGILATMAAGTIGATTKAALLAALAAKTADTGGDTPRLGWPKVRGG